MGSRDITLKIMSKLESFGATNIRDQLLKEKSDKPGRSDKIRFNFRINSTEEALTCYNYFTKRHSRLQEAKHSHNKDKAVEDDLGLKETIVIYLQMEEDIFVKYGDEEAKLYYELEALEQQRVADLPKEDYKKGGKKPNRDRGDRPPKKSFNDPVSVEEAKEFGLNFREGPPKFKNDKKRDDNDRRTVTDHTNEKRNLREIINEANDENDVDQKDKPYHVRKGNPKRGGYD